MAVRRAAGLGEGRLSNPITRHPGVYSSKDIARPPTSPSFPRCERTHS